MVQALLVGLVTFIAYIDEWIGFAMLSRPIVIGTLMGAVLGDLSTGMQLGIALELIFLGSQAIGAAIPLDFMVGSALGSAIAITTGQGASVAVAVAIPAAGIATLIQTTFYGVIFPLITERIDRYAEEGDSRKISIGHVVNSFLFSITFAVLSAVAFYVGGPRMQTILDKIPTFIIDGMGVAAAILPAIGFALLLKMMISKKLAAFFFIGFLMAAYMNVSVIGVVCFAIMIVMILYMNGNNKQNAEVQTEVDDNEF